MIILTESWMSLFKSLVIIKSMPYEWQECLEFRKHTNRSAEHTFIPLTRREYQFKAICSQLCELCSALLRQQSSPSIWLYKTFHSHSSGTQPYIFRSANLFTAHQWNHCKFLTISNKFAIPHHESHWVSGPEEFMQGRYSSLLTLWARTSIFWLNILVASYSNYAGQQTCSIV